MLYCIINTISYVIKYIDYNIRLLRLSNIHLLLRLVLFCRLRNLYPFTYEIVQNSVAVLFFILSFQSICAKLFLISL